MRPIVPGSLVAMNSRCHYDDALWSSATYSGPYLVLGGTRTVVSTRLVGLVVSVSRVRGYRSAAHVLFPGHRLSDYAYVDSLVHVEGYEREALDVLV